jgi:8-oxo-dGTP pyrophosphatase MutT (NUDIX family)
VSTNEQPHPSWSCRPSWVDLAWQTAYRVGFPLARIWWRLRRDRNEGALVAIRVDGALLLVRSSYRREWNFPGGGVRAGEAPDAAARRELMEELGVSVPVLNGAGVFTGLCEGRRGRVHLFELHLEEAPALRLDGREIIAARLVPPGDVATFRLTPPVAAYVAGRVS